MSGAITWMRCSGRPATIAYTVRWACGAWVFEYSVSLPDSGFMSAIVPHVSIGAGCDRG